jgi:hypothetical protein
MDHRVWQRLLLLLVHVTNVGVLAHRRTNAFALHHGLVLELGVVDVVVGHGELGLVLKRVHGLDLMDDATLHNEDAAVRLRLRSFCIMGHPGTSMSLAPCWASPNGHLEHEEGVDCQTDGEGGDHLEREE